ncbi:MAG TPA: hypothetical protein VNB90_13035 [Cytophagaceae bacterium]|jgi:hypothetical protein|nr:hypothetical protein [Cytophagaceae bacterium]
MKKMWFKGIVLAVIWTLAATSCVLAQDGKKKKTNNTTTPNANYKHTIPSSQGHTFKENFTAAPPDTVNRNYKQQNHKKSNIRFRDHFVEPGKQDHRSYKDPEGL